MGGLLGGTKARNEKKFLIVSVSQPFPIHSRLQNISSFKRIYKSEVNEQGSVLQPNLYPTVAVPENMDIRVRVSVMYSSSATGRYIHLTGTHFSIRDFLFMCAPRSDGGNPLRPWFEAEQMTSVHCFNGRLRVEYIPQPDAFIIDSKLALQSPDTQPLEQRCTIVTPT